MVLMPTAYLFLAPVSGFFGGAWGLWSGIFDALWDAAQAQSRQESQMYRCAKGAFVWGTCGTLFKKDNIMAADEAKPGDRRRVAETCVLTASAQALPPLPALRAPLNPPSETFHAAVQVVGFGVLSVIGAFFFLRALSSCRKRRSESC